MYHIIHRRLSTNFCGLVPHDSLIIIEKTRPVGIKEEAIFVGEMMVKEEINDTNECDEVGMSDANVEATLKT
jgi:hypothetical protein